MAQLVAFVGLVHLASLAIDSVDAMALATSMGLASLESPLGLTQALNLVLDGLPLDWHWRPLPFGDG
jgi:hypothetical protein